MIEVTPPGGLAFKAREIEELVDVVFFRRLGIVFARAARVLRLTPTHVTCAAMAAGVAGGALIASERYALTGVALLILHGVLDSSDGQLARLTGRSTDFGRMLDGMSGYVTHIAMYFGIIASALSRGYGMEFVAVSAIAGFCTAVHAQMYDYHRTTYTAYAIHGQALPSAVGKPHGGILGMYEAMQRLIAGRHPDVERRLGARADNGRISAHDRKRYRACFYRPVRGWNLMGDNVRRLSIAAAAWFHRPEWFIAAELVPLNVAFVVLWWVQRRADSRFLAAA